MTIIKQWVDWKPRYVLTDDSSIEQLAIQKVFRGLYIGEQEVMTRILTYHWYYSAHAN